MTEHHFSFDELAELDEGLLTPEQADAAREHLHGCDECRGRADAIAGTRATLAQLPPVTMPADVVARLSQALADEAAADPATGNPAHPLPSETVMPDVVDLTKRRRWMGQPTLAASAVAAVVVLLVGGIIINHHNSPGSSGGSTTAGSLAPTADSAGGVAGVSGANTSDTYTAVASGRVYTATNAKALVTTLLAPAAAAAPEVTPPPTSSKTAPSPGAVPGTSTSTVAPQSATHATSPTFSQLNIGPTPGALKSIATSDKGVLTCAATLLGKGAVPEAVDFARWSDNNYTRAPSIILVFNGPRPSTATVIVAAPDCTTFRTELIVDLPG